MDGLERWESRGGRPRRRVLRWVDSGDTKDARPYRILAEYVRGAKRMESNGIEGFGSGNGNGNGNGGESKVDAG